MKQITGDLVLPIAIYLAWASCGLADPPELTHTSPLAVFPGSVNEVVFHGQRLHPAQQVWSNLPGPAVLAGEKSQATNVDKLVHVTIDIPADARPGIYAARLTTTAGVSPPILLMVDNLKSDVELGNNQSRQSAQLLHSPGAVDGAGAGPESDYYCLDMVSGQWLTIDIVAARIGYAFDPLLRIFDESGNDLAVVDDSEGLQGDCQIRFQSPQDQRIYLQVSDSRLSNSARHKYRLRLGDFPLATASFPDAAAHLDRYVNSSLPNVEMSTTVPNNSEQTALLVEVPSAINGRFETTQDEHFFRMPLVAGDRLKVSGITRSLGSAADLLFKIVAPNKELVATHDDTGLDEANFEFVAANAGDHFIIIREINRRYGPAYSYRCEITKAKPSFELIANTDRLNIGQGGVGLLSLSCIRNGYDGPITLRFVEPQADYQLANHILDSGVNETVLKVIPNVKLPIGNLQMLGIQGVGNLADAEPTQQPAPAWLNVSAALRQQFPALAYPPAELLDQLAVAIADPLPKFFGLRLATEEILFPRIVGETYFTVYCVDRLDDFKDPINLFAINLPEKVKASDYERPVGNSQNSEYRFAINGPADLPLGAQHISIRASGEHRGQNQEVVIGDIPFRVIEPLIIKFELSEQPQSPNELSPNELSLRITAQRFVARQGGDRKEIICRWKEAPTWLSSPDQFVIEAGKNEQTFVLPLRPSSDNVARISESRPDNVARISESRQNNVARISESRPDNVARISESRPDKKTRLGESSDDNKTRISESSDDSSKQLTSLVMLAETTINGQCVRVESEPYDIASFAAEPAKRE